MGLRDQAELDLGAILEDAATGFGWAITLTSPAGVAAAMTGFSSDISALIDPGTGQAISGRMATIALRMRSVATAFPSAGLPVGIAETTGKPWLVTFKDISGTSHTFKIAKSTPDRALGLLTCTLEAYTA